MLCRMRNHKNKMVINCIKIGLQYDKHDIRTQCITWSKYSKFNSNTGLCSMYMIYSMEYRLRLYILNN